MTLVIIEEIYSMDNCNWFGQVTIKAIVPGVEKNQSEDKNYIYIHPMDSAIKAITK